MINVDFYSPNDERKYDSLQAVHLLSKCERKSVFRQAILRRAPGISVNCLNQICESINLNRNYYIKATADKQKFLNLSTRERIITADIRALSEVLPLYGCFKSPFFEKVGDNRFYSEGELDLSGQAAAVKIRISTENKRTTVTYFLLVYLAEKSFLHTI